MYHTRSTRRDIKIGICAACHPFFTGEQKFVDTAGRVEKFARRYGSTKATRAGEEGLDSCSGGRSDGRTSRRLDDRRYSLWTLILLSNANANALPNSNSEIADPRLFDNRKRAGEIMREHSSMKAVACATGANSRPRGASSTTIANWLLSTTPTSRKMAQEEIPALEKRVPISSAICRSRCFRPMKMMSAMQSSKSAPAPVEAKQPFSRPIFIACTTVMRNPPDLKIEDLESSPSELGGLKEVIFQSVRRISFPNAALRKRRASGAACSRD